MATTDTPKPLRLEEGRTYRNAAGRKIGPMRPWPPSEDYPWTEDAQGGVYADDGTPWNRSQYAQLVEEWTELSATDRLGTIVWNSPVQTHTTVRTVIVPGTYGRVHVRGVTINSAAAMLSLISSRGLVSDFGAEFNPEELRAAADTLTQLADGLDRIAQERTDQ